MPTLALQPHWGMQLQSAVTLVGASASSTKFWRVSSRTGTFGIGTPKIIIGVDCRVPSFVVALVTLVPVNHVDCAGKEEIEKRAAR